MSSGEPTTEPTRETLELPSDRNASGRDFGSEELALLRDVLRSGVLNCTFGTQVSRFERDFAARYGVAHARAVNTGSAACQAAIAALELDPGDEVITTPITDMGAIAALLFQGLVPVFADVDPRSLNVTPASIESRVTERTRAVVVTHLFGNPCDMLGIEGLARSRRLHLVEDCSQAFLAETDGRLVGTFGATSAFSLQQGKHMTTGEGGVVVSDDAGLARVIRLFSDKAWGYGDPAPDHYFLAPNLRMSELCGAVARAQLAKLDRVVTRRREAAAMMDELLGPVHGVDGPRPAPGAVHTYWKYALDVDPAIIAGGAVALGEGLKERGVACAPRYIQKPAFECQVLRDQRTFGRSRWPLSLRPDGAEPSRDDFPGVYEGLARVVVLPWNEFYQAEHVEFIARAIEDVAKCLTQT